VVEHIESQYTAFLNHEMRADRSAGEDGRVHVALYFIEPTGHSYGELPGGAKGWRYRRVEAN